MGNPNYRLKFSAAMPPLPLSPNGVLQWVTKFHSEFIEVYNSIVYRLEELILADEYSVFDNHADVANLPNARITPRGQRQLFHSVDTQETFVDVENPLAPGNFYWKPIDTDRGLMLTDVTGLASILFKRVYSAAGAMPIIHITVMPFAPIGVGDPPVLGGAAGIHYWVDSWAYDGSGNYEGCHVFVTDLIGNPMFKAIVFWRIVEYNEWNPPA